MFHDGKTREDVRMDDRRCWGAAGHTPRRLWRKRLRHDYREQMSRTDVWWSRERRNALLLGKKDMGARPPAPLSSSLSSGTHSLSSEFCHPCTLLPGCSVPPLPLDEPVNRHPIHLVQHPPVRQIVPGCKIRTFEIILNTSMYQICTWIICSFSPPSYQF